MTCLRRRRRAEYPEMSGIAYDESYRTRLAAPCFAKVLRSALSLFAVTKCVPSQTSRSASQTFADQAVIAIENVRLFKELQERNAELRRPWSIRRRPPKCLGIISRSPTDVQPVLDAIVESAAGFAGSMTLGLRLARREQSRSCGSFRSAYLYAVPPRSVLMSHSLAGCASMARSTFPTSVRTDDFPNVGLSVTGSRTFLTRAPSSARGTHRST